MTSAPNVWQLVPWEGNPSLNHMCWRRKIGKTTVSVGAGDFLTISFDAGPSSDDSFSSTRWRPDGNLTEQEGMAYAERVLAGQ